MEFRHLGRSGLVVSAIGLGCNPFGNEVDKTGAAQIVDTAFNCGINYFDTANTYFDGRSEELLGQALEGRRHEVIVASKFGNPTGKRPNDQGASRKHIFEACEASLRRLRTDYIDVYQVHSPDRHTPVEETMRALDDLVRQGKVRYIGCSNYYAWEIAEAIWFSRQHGLAEFVSCQDFYNILYRDIEKRFEPFCVKYGLGMIPFFPLAGGLLGGDYSRGVTPPPGTRGAIRPSFKVWDTDHNWDMVEGLSAFAKARGWSLPQMSNAWLLTRSQMATVIPGADKPEHVIENVKALEVRFSDEDLQEIDRLTVFDDDRTLPPVFNRPTGR